MPTPVSVLRPAGFHGTGRLRRHARGKSPRSAYFEGWYLKLVSADRATRIAVIPGVFLSEDGSVAEAFVQVLDGIAGRTAYHRFDLSEFRADEHRFDVQVGVNRFGPDGMWLDLPGLRADVRFGPLTGWPVTLREPGAMGWYAWVPTMECYHGVVSLDHALAGWIETDAGRVDLAEGRGYIEKDWGVAFPQAYVWMQSNHFAQSGVCLVASTALIPWRSSAFRGDLVALRIPDGPAAGLHRFTSYTRARTDRLDVDATSVDWTLTAPDGRRLELSAAVPGPITDLLHAPVRTEMHQRVAETLDATVTDPVRRCGRMRRSRDPRSPRPAARDPRSAKPRPSGRCQDKQRIRGADWLHAGARSSPTTQSEDTWARLRTSSRRWAVRRTSRRSRPARPGCAPWWPIRRWSTRRP